MLTLLESIFPPVGSIDAFSVSHKLAKVLVFPFLLSFLRSVAPVWPVAAGHITPKAHLMGQQCQAETFQGFLPTKQNIATGMDYTACASLCYFGFNIFKLLVCNFCHQTQLDF